jgi:hypothetical protein
VFGLRERKSGRCFFEIVANRDREHLLPIIYKHCKPKWSAYNDIALLNENYKHFSVNHKLHFVAPEPVEIATNSNSIEQQKLHTNGIESDSNGCKSRFKLMLG